MISRLLPALLLPLCALAERAPVSWEVEAAFSAIGDAQFRRSSDLGEVNVAETEFRAIASIQAQPGFLVRLGLQLQRFDFGLPKAAPLPNHLESLALVVGGDFQVGEAWLVRLDLHPGFYSANGRVDGGDFNIPLTLGGSYFVNADLQLVLGLSLDVQRKYPVLPAAGVRWKLARDWVLNAILPTPRLEYRLTPDWMLYIGADFQGDTYRMDDAFGRAHGLRKLDRAVVDYSQIRVGAGASWKVNAHFNLEVEAGWVPVHDFDYHRADIAVRAQESPPYARIGLHAEF